MAARWPDSFSCPAAEVEFNESEPYDLHCGFFRHRVRDAGLAIAVASSAKKDEVDKYLDIARIADLVDLKTSADDVEESKPAPDIFEIVLRKLTIEGADAVAIGDTPYDAEAAGKATIATVGVLCGGFTEGSLRQAGCVEIYPGPAAQQVGDRREGTHKRQIFSLETFAAPFLHFLAVVSLFVGGQEDGDELVSPLAYLGSSLLEADIVAELEQSFLPCERVEIHRVQKCAVNVEDSSFHNSSSFTVGAREVPHTSQHKTCSSPCGG